MFPLQVDPRAGSEKLIPKLRDLGIRVTAEQMEFGDVAWLGNGPEGIVSVGVEYKTLGDVMSCIADGRFAAHQLPGMQECYEVRWLVVSGEWKADRGGELLVKRKGNWTTVPGQNRQVWTFAALEHWFETIRMEGGFHVAYMPDIVRSAMFIKARYTWWQREWAEHKSLNVFNRAMARCVVRPGITKRMAKEVPGVGWELADKVARHFGTPRKMVNATVDEWMQVAKIGPTIAKRAVWLMANGKEK